MFGGIVTAAATARTALLTAVVPAGQHVLVTVVGIDAFDPVAREFVFLEIHRNGAAVTPYYALSQWRVGNGKVPIEILAAGGEQVAVVAWNRSGEPGFPAALAVQMVASLEGTYQR